MGSLPELERLRAVRLLAMDVDGVLTDGGLVWTVLPGEGTPLETKRFDVKDGLAISLARDTPLEIAWLTGRRTGVVERRARELGVAELHQGARDKKAVLEAVRERLGRDRAEVAYLGDDLNDLPAYEAAGLRVAVADAAPELLAAADWVTERPGGRGAVREVVETLLHAQGFWEAAVASYLARLREEQGLGVGQ